MTETKLGIQEVTNRPDFPALEREMLDWWTRSDIPGKYLRRNVASAERFSFLDGPITANNPMGVHHAWGRTYKDLFLRYQTMLGKRLRYQNGFDCQGLWVEVEVEKELGLKNKRDIESYGVADFVERCKQRVLRFADRITLPVHSARLLDGLGQLILYDVRREQLHDLVLPEDCSRAWLAVQGARRHALVPQVRHRHL